MSEASTPRSRWAWLTPVIVTVACCAGPDNLMRSSRLAFEWGPTLWMLWTAGWLASLGLAIAVRWAPSTARASMMSALAVLAAAAMIAQASGWAPVAARWPSRPIDDAPGLRLMSLVDSGSCELRIADCRVALEADCIEYGGVNVPCFDNRFEVGEPRWVDGAVQVEANDQLWRIQP